MPPFSDVVIMLCSLALFIGLLMRNLFLLIEGQYWWKNKRQALLILLGLTLITPLLSQSMFTWFIMVANILMLIVFLIRPCREEEIEAGLKSH